MGLNQAIIAAIRNRLDQPEGRNDQQVLESVLRLATTWRSTLLANTQRSLVGPEVQSGPFTGMKYVTQATEGALFPRLLGVYESELHPHLEAFAESGVHTIADVGCAEGYYAVGLARMIPDATIHAFDIDPNARRACAELARLNGVEDRVLIGEAFGPEDFDRFTGPRALVFMDVEGAEDQLLDPERSPALKACNILVEVHRGPGDLAARLLERFEPSHDIIRVDAHGKDPALPDWMHELSHLDRLLAVWEWRLFPTPWLVMRPKGA